MSSAGQDDRQRAVAAATGDLRPRPRQLATFPGRRTPRISGLARIAAPGLVIGGARSYGPQAKLAEAGRADPALPPVIGTGHNMHREQPGAVTATVPGWPASADRAMRRLRWRKPN